VSDLARENNVSRKFVYQQADKAHKALEEAFDKPGGDAEVLFWLPVTKAWLRQFVLALILACHASYRGVVELLRDLFDTSFSVGSVHNIVCQAVAQARQVNLREDLSGIRVGAPDEIFQGGNPILVGCDVGSTYCYLLTEEESRDATTWGVRLLELQERGLRLSHTIADFGKGLRAGQKEALPEVACWGDHFHVFRQMGHVVTYLQNRAMGTISTREDLEQKMRRAKKQAKGQALSKRLACARNAEAQAIELADEIALLFQWMQDDILSVVGPDLVTRRELYDFVVEELRIRQSQAPHCIGPLVRLLKNGREDLLAFAADAENRLRRLAEEFHVASHLVWDLFQCQALPQTDPRRWAKEGELLHLLADRFHPVKQAVQQVIDTTVRASSVVENLNSRLRNYFFLRRQLGADYLDLLRFFLNHRRFIRSEYPQREGRSPAEILTGREHPHWLSLLGFTPFKKAS
jgi:hypothetical protein